mmetsp:Transcript_2298/g.5393  ORF Transcript_2298/g.5393 Transcript_2298/m.5393 type:complete len:106 (+) Transcript_2298:696-1013(+)
MHFDDRVTKHLFAQTLQTGGLSHTASGAQGLYTVHRYTHMFHDQLQSLMLLSVGDDLSRLKEIPAVVGQLFSSVCGTRWLSSERQSTQLVKLLNAPAAEELITLV